MKSGTIGRIGTPLALVAVGLLAGSAVQGAVVLNAASGPTATFTGSASNAVNFTTEGDAAWAYYPNTAANGTAATPDEKASNPTAFSALTTVVPTGGSAVGFNGRTGNTAAGVAAAVTTTASDSTTGALNGLPGYSYITPPASGTGYGEQGTYTLPANASQTLSLYCYTLNGVLGELKLTTPDGTVYDDGAAGVALPVSAAMPTKGGGVYRFDLTNDSAAPVVLTFSYTVAAYPSGVTSGQIGFEGATAATPEPALLGLAGLSAIGLLARRRQARSAS